MNDADLTERLRAAAGALPVGDPPIEAVERVGRVRLARRIGAATLAVLIVASGTTWGLLAFRGVRPATKPGTTTIGSVFHASLPDPPQLLANSGDAAWVIASGKRPGAALYRVDSNGNSRVIELGGDPTGVAANRKAVWLQVCPDRFPDPDDCGEGLLVELDPATGAQRRSVKVGPQYSGHLLAADERAVWLSGPESLLRIDAVTLARKKLECCAGILAMGLGAVWVASFENELIRLDAVTGEVVWRVPFDACRGIGSLVVADDAVWYAACEGPLHRFDPDTGEKLGTTTLPVQAVPLAGDGHVWSVSRDRTTNLLIQPIEAASGRPTGEPHAIRGSPVRFGYLGLGPAPMFASLGDDEIWITDYSAGEVLRAELVRGDADPQPVHAPIERYMVGGRPIRPMSVGYGAAWTIVQGGGDGRLLLKRIDQETGQHASVDAAGEAGLVTLGAGSVWTATCAHPDAPGTCSETRIVRIDPVTLKALAEIPIDDLIWGLAFGEGSAWVATSTGTEGRLVRIDAASNRIVDTVEGWPCCGDLAFGEGAVWGLGSSGALDGELTRFDLATEQLSHPEKLRPHSRFGGHGLAVGEGAVWVVLGIGGRSPIARMDPETGEVTHVVKDVAFGWFAAAEGGLWTARSALNAPCLEVLRLDPETGQPDTAVPIRLGEAKYVNIGIGGPSYTVGAGDGAVWVGVDVSWEVIRIDLAGLMAREEADPACSN